MLFALHLASSAWAEGTADVGVSQALSVGPGKTILYVDILSAGEAFTWVGDNQIEVFHPWGQSLGLFQSGETITASDLGAYKVIVDPTGNAPGGVEANWDITVVGAASGMGRVWSDHWIWNSGNFTEAAAFTGSYYALVDGGGVGATGIVEMKPEGLAGFIYFIAANDHGVPGAQGRSVYQVSSTALPQYPIYLHPPEIGGFNALQPTVGNAEFSSNGLCQGAVSAGVASGEFTFDSDVNGTYHVVCDLSQDGFYDITSDDDLHVLGPAMPGRNTVQWDGTDNLGVAAPPGTYSCRIILTVGEFHYVSEDIETCYTGFRLFEVQSPSPISARTGLNMYWNDSAVIECRDYDGTAGSEGCKAVMPGGESAVDNSGPLGMYSGNYNNPPVPNVNTRAWGDFTGAGKGDKMALDTYTWLLEDRSGVFLVEVIDGVADTDGDTLSDGAERCLHGTLYTSDDTDADGLLDNEELALGTNPLSADTDADGWPDGVELPDPSAPRDTDGDGKIDALDTDDDDDGLLSADELSYGADPLLADSDGDGLLDGAEVALGISPSDRDSDDDDLEDGEEVLVTFTNPGTPDSDGDGLSDGDEVHNTGTDPNNADSDSDGLSDGDEFTLYGSDPNDPDTDDDGLSDGLEATLGTDLTRADTDGDGLDDRSEVQDYSTNPLKSDSDHDGLSDRYEIKRSHTDPNRKDTDGDSVRDGDEVNTYGSDPNAVDSDGDGLDDGDEVDLGTDLSDADSDGDGLTDWEEVVEYGTDPLRRDTDGDSLTDRYELKTSGSDPKLTDSDGDALSDGEEVDFGSSPLLRDTDGDNLDDAEERVSGTDPNEPDTDGGGTDDGTEVHVHGTDPLDPFDDQVVAQALELRPAWFCNSSGGAGGGAGFLLVVLLSAVGRRRGPTPLPRTN